MKKTSHDMDLALVAGVRTPFCRAGTDLRGAHAADLATHTFRELLDRTGIDPARIDEVILGCGGPEPGEVNVARVAALRAGVPQAVPAVTVQRNCASGMEAIDQAWLRLQAGRGELFLVGGAESMSNYPLIMGERLTRMFERLSRSKSLWQRARTALAFRPSHLAPRIALQEGLTDPVSGLLMGLTAERIARRFGIDRTAQDAFALRSHHRAAAATVNGRFAAEIAPLSAPPRHDAFLGLDNGVRPEQSMNALAKLRPVFDKREGDVTVGNACQITDGAVGLLLMSLARARSLGLRPLAVLRGHGHAGLDPAAMGLGPVHAMPKALADAGLGFGDVELFEINEAFAAQVLACIAAAASGEYCRTQVGLPGALGEIDPARLNVNGGAIALGHPIAASGARLLLTLAEELRERSLHAGMASLCIGGGQGQAIVLEAA